VILPSQPVSWIRLSVGS